MAHEGDGVAVKTNTTILRFKCPRCHELVATPVLIGNPSATMSCVSCGFVIHANLNWHGDSAYIRGNWRDHVTSWVESTMWGDLRRHDEISST